MRSAATLLLGRPDPLAIFDAMATDVVARGALTMDAARVARAQVELGHLPSTALLATGAPPDIVLRALSVVAGVPVAPPRAHWIIDVRGQIGVEESTWQSLLAVCVGVFDGRPLVAFGDLTKIASSAALALPDHAPCVALEHDVRDALSIMPAQARSAVAFLAPPDAVAKALPSSSSPFGPLTNQPQAFPGPNAMGTPVLSNALPRAPTPQSPFSGPQAPLPSGPLSSPLSSLPRTATPRASAPQAGPMTMLFGAPASSSQPTPPAPGPSPFAPSSSGPSSFAPSSSGPSPQSPAQSSPSFLAPPSHAGATMLGVGPTPPAQGAAPLQPGVAQQPAAGVVGGTLIGVGAPAGGEAREGDPFAMPGQSPAGPSGTMLNTPAGQQVASAPNTRVVSFDDPPQPSPSQAFAAPHVAPSVTSGSQCGRFVLEKLIGQGGMATVFLANDGRSQAAVKVVHDHLLRTGQGEELRRRFQREVAAMRKLEHKNIVACLDAGRVGDTEYLATEFMAGGSLSGLLMKRGKLPPSLALSFFSDLVEGLAHAHDNGVVHRDLKPDNLLLDEKGALKIADFGIARVNEGTQITATGRTVGTPAYMSPEQATGSALDGRSDLYSAGVILYELLTGRNPFEGDSVGATLANVMTGNVRPIAEVEPAVPFLVDVVLARLLPFRPDDRLPSARAVLEALAPLLDRARAAEPMRAPVVAGTEGAVAAAVARDCALFVDVAKREQSAGKRLRAGLAAFRATTMNPDQREARAILTALNREGQLKFSRSTTADLFTLESSLERLQGADRQAAQRQVAKAYLDENNPAFAAVHLRRAIAQHGIDEVDLAMIARVLPDDEVDAVRTMPKRIGELSNEAKADAAAKAWKPQGPASSPPPLMTQNMGAQRSPFDQKLIATAIVDRDGHDGAPHKRGVPMAALVGVGVVAVIALIALAFALGALFGHH